MSFKAESSILDSVKKYRKMTKSLGLRPTQPLPTLTSNHDRLRICQRLTKTESSILETVKKDRKMTKSLSLRPSQPLPTLTSNHDPLQICQRLAKSESSILDSVKKGGQRTKSRSRGTTLTGPRDPAHQQRTADPTARHGYFES